MFKFFAFFDIVCSNEATTFRTDSSKPELIRMMRKKISLMPGSQAGLGPTPTVPLDPATPSSLLHSLRSLTLGFKSSLATP